MVAGVAADAGNDGHQRGECDDFFDTAFKRADNAAGEKGGAEVDGKPHPAVFHRIPDRRKQIFLFLQTRHVQHVRFRFFTDNVHHLVDGNPADELFVLIDHGRGHQVITFERLRRFFHIVFGTEAHDFGRHHVRHQVFGISNQKFADGQHALQDVVFIDHENLVSMVGQALETAQVTQHHFASNVGADADQLEVHNRADLVVFIRHRRLDLGTLFLVARLQGFIDHLVRQIARQLRQLVRVQVIDRRQQLVFVHRLDQRFAHRVGYFQQHFTVVFRRDQQPGDITFARRQRFQHRRHVGRVQLVQKDGQLGKFVA